MADEAKAEKEQEVVSVELPAPPGWKKKFIPKKAGTPTPKRGEIIFISPSGDEIRSKKQLEKYLRSNSGGPSFSDFDWGSGDTPRRSARISEKTKALEASEEEPPKKRGRVSSSKKGAKQKDADTLGEDGEDGEDEEDEASDGEKTATEALQNIEDTHMKDSEGGSFHEGNEEGTTEIVIVDNSNKADSNEGTEQEKDVETVAEDETREKGAGSIEPVEIEALESEKGVNTKAVESVEVADTNNVEDDSVKVKNEAAIKGIADDNSTKVDSSEGAEREMDDADAYVDDKELESEKEATQVLESVDVEMKDSDDSLVKNGNNEATHEVVLADNSGEDDANEDSKLEKGDVNTELDSKALESEEVVTQALESIEDSEMTDALDSSDKVITDVISEKVDSNEGNKHENDDVASEVVTVDGSYKEGSNEGAKQEKVVDDDVDVEADDEALTIEKVSTQALASAENFEIKDAVEISYDEGKEAASAEVVIMEDNTSKVDSIDNVDAGAAECDNIATQVLENDEDANIKDAEDDFVGKVSAVEVFMNDGSSKLDLHKETKQVEDNADAEALESDNVAAQALESVGDKDIKNAEDDFARGEDAAAAEVITEDSSSKVGSIAETIQDNDNADAEALESDNITTQHLESVGHADVKDAEDGFVEEIEEAASKVTVEDSFVEDDKIAEEEAANENDLYQNSVVNPSRVGDNEQEILAQEEPNVDFISTPEVATLEETEIEIEYQVESEVLTYEAEPCKENLHAGEEVTDETLSNDNHKGEQVSPSKAIPTANHVDMQSPHKASAIV